VLDVGAGTGLYAQCLPPSAQYVWFDNDPNKLRGFLRRRAPHMWTVMGDARRIGVKDKGVDYVMCTGVTHHLSDAELSQFLGELARVARRGVILLDSVTTGGWLSHMLWKLDRGSHPRTKESLLRALRTHFRLEYIEERAAFHRYVVMVASPAPSTADSYVWRTGEAEWLSEAPACPSS
jgi:ubiquinone/menaquinone biosynthesis C-methylase UbiE